VNARFLCIKMKNKLKKNRKIISYFIPNLTAEREIKHVKNSLLVFLFGITVFYGLAFFLTGKIILSNTPEQVFTKTTPIYETTIKKMVKNRPLEAMVPYITKQKKKTATFLVAIAKKESDWGKYSPKKGKKECYNYWGFRGTYNQTTSGYSCFDSEKQAVEVVGKRIDELINQGINTPEEMIVWKCGSSCDGHSTASVKKWISDVDYYFQKISG
jgi:hypothetical protein